MWRLANIGALGESDRALDHLLSMLKLNRDQKGIWHRFPFFYTLLALSELDHPKAIAELKYALPVCRKKLSRLKPKDIFSERRILLLDRIDQKIG